VRAREVYPGARLNGQLAGPKKVTSAIRWQKGGRLERKRERRRQ